MHKSSKLLIFTDLDGTLLDYQGYSYEAALPALRKLKENRIPLIIVSSKTKSEIETYSELRAMAKAFIAENGSAIFLDNDFSPPPGIRVELRSGYRVIVLGRRYRVVLKALHRARTLCKTSLKGFSEMTVEEIAQLTGLDPEAAALAKDREFSEPFQFNGSPAELECLIERLSEMGIAYLEGGRLSYAQGSVDKGRAAWLVKNIYRNAYPDISWKTVSLGDGPNDVGFLHIADVAVVIRKPDRTCLDYIPAPPQQVITSTESGPAGWNEVVLKLLEGQSSG